MASAAAFFAAAAAFAANPPTSPVVSAVYSTSATFSWNANGNPAGTYYQVVVSTDPAFNIVTSTLTVSATAATAVGLLPGVIYYASVAAIPLTASVTFPPTTTATNADITVSSSPASPYFASAGLVGSWQFDEDTGTVTSDLSANGNTGNFGCTTAACVSTPTWAASLPGLGSAASFSGQAGGVVLTNSGAPFAFPGSVTVEAWVNPASAFQSAGTGIVAVGPQNTEDFALDVSASGSYRFLISNGAAEFTVTVATAAIAAGQWTHVVGVYNAAQTAATLYLNGLPAAVATGLPASRSNSGSLLSIGNRMSSGGLYTLPFAGRIDAVRVFNGARTAPQVLTDYQSGFISSVTFPSPNNGVIVALPPNAFCAPPYASCAAAQIFISADPVNHPIHITPAALSAGLAVTPSGLTLVPNSLIEVVPVIAGVPFTALLGSSATVTIPYPDPSDSGIISGTNPPLAAAGIQMYELNTAVNTWTLLPTTVDRAAQSASALTPSFSVFALFAPQTIGLSLASVRVYPVPWKPGSGGRFDATGVTFADLPASGSIRILTLAGVRVRDLSFSGASAGAAVWDGANNYGQRAASGVYFARITSGVDGTTTLVKFAIER
jgi:hypothetical protein